jgi:hypothetical protein
VGIKEYRSWDSSVGIVTRLQAGQPSRCGLIPARGTDFSLLDRVQNGVGVLPVGTGRLFFPLLKQPLWCAQGQFCFTD